MHSNGNSVTAASPNGAFQCVQPAPHLVNVPTECEQRVVRVSGHSVGNVRHANEGASTRSRRHEPLALQVLDDGLDGHLGDAVAARECPEPRQTTSELALADALSEVSGDLVSDRHGAVAVDAHTASVATTAYSALAHYEAEASSLIDQECTSVHYGTYAFDNTNREDDAMKINDPASLADCVAQLDDAGRRAVRRYWERVIREEWVPPSRWERRTAPVDGAARQSREARRAMARVAASGRLAPVLSLSTSTPAAASGVAVSGVAA